MRNGNFYIALSSAHLSTKLSWKEQFCRLNRMGADGIEFFGADFSDMNLAEAGVVKSDAEDLGITVHPWFDLTEEEVEDAVTSLQNMLEKCAILRAGFINIHMNFLANSTQGVRRIIDIAQALDPILRVNNQVLLFENVPNYLENSLGSHLKEFTQFFTAMTSESFGLTIDTGHCNINGDFEEMALHLSSVWRYTHFADNNGISDDHVGPGMGSVPWEHVAEVMTRIDYSGPIVLEYPEKYIPDTAEHLRRAFAAQGRTWPLFKSSMG